MNKFFKLTTKRGFDQFNRRILQLALFKEGRLFESMECCSGYPGEQFFRAGVDSVADNMEPIPEGHWIINDLIWAGQTGDVIGAIENSNNKPMTIPLEYVGSGNTQRSAVNIRVNHNWEFAPGTQGCINIYNQNDFEKLLTWLRDKDSRDLYVEWNLGTCPKPLPIAA